jgi:hypothetical protein
MGRRRWWFSGVSHDQRTDQPSAPSQIIVVQQFDAMLKRLVPTE